MTTNWLHLWKTVFLMTMGNEGYRDKANCWVALHLFRLSRHQLQISPLFLKPEMKNKSGIFMGTFLENDLAPPLEENEECWYQPILESTTLKGLSRLRWSFPQAQVCCSHAQILIISCCEFWSALEKNGLHLLLIFSKCSIVSWYRRTKKEDTVFGNSPLLAVSICRIRQAVKGSERDTLRYAPFHREVFLWSWWAEVHALWLRIHWPPQKN